MAILGSCVTDHTVPEVSRPTHSASSTASFWEIPQPQALSHGRFLKYTRTCTQNNHTNTIQLAVPRFC